MTHSRNMGWESLTNGKLFAVVTAGEFDVIITVDKNMRSQQNIRVQTFALITLNSLLIDYRYIAPLATLVHQVLDGQPAAGNDIVISPDGVVWH